MVFIALQQSNVTRFAARILIVSERARRTCGKLFLTAILGHAVWMRHGNFFSVSV
jgi:hypothetical protein